VRQASNESLHWRERIGSFSTHGSRRGTNYLGWGLPEDMSPEDERKCLAAVVKGLTKQITDGVLSKEEKKEVGREILMLTTRMNAIRPKAKNTGLDRYVLDILREEMPKRQFQILITRATARMHAAAAQAAPVDQPQRTDA
jgi:hypothetical protein